MRVTIFGATGLLGKALPTVGIANTLAGILPADFQLHFAPDANVPADVQVFEHAVPTASFRGACAVAVPP